MSEKVWINDIFDIRESKGGNLYVKFTEDTDTLDKFNKFLSKCREEGESAAVFLKKNQDSLDEALEAGRIDEDKHAYLTDTLKFIKYKGSCSFEE